MGEESFNQALATKRKGDDDDDEHVNKKQKENADETISQKNLVSFI